MFNKKTKKEIVYSSTDLSDLLSSPVFYSVIALTFILGLSSIFGFFNNPRKLKTVVDVISQKLSVNPNTNTVSYDADVDYLLRNHSLKELSVQKETHFSIKSDNSYNVSDNGNGVILYSALNANSNQDAQRVSFDYNIASDQFWGSLDVNRIESMIDQNQQQNLDTLMIGAPLSSEYFLEQGDAKYSMRAGILRL